MTTEAQDAKASASDARPSGGHFSAKSALQKVLNGELGSVRVLVVLAFIWVIFSIANDRFLTSINLTNLALQIAGLGAIAIGVVLVLLLGEIDLSVGAVSGLAAAVMTVLSVNHDWPAVPAILAGLCTGAIIGLVQGTLSTQLRIPSFVITLAGLLAWQGALLAVLGDQGTINISDPAITSLAGTFLGAGLSWALAGVGIAAVAGVHLVERARRAAAGLEVRSAGSTWTRVISISLAIILATYVMTSDRGVPLSLLILQGLVIAVSLLLSQSTFGRHVYAVGGNAEAARRAGIRVARVRILVFTLASTLAAAGGILLASRLLAVNQSSGASDLLLLAIASAVIGGVSLFGGRGSAWAALLGALVIGSISNGMDLLALQSSVKFMVTGGVLVAAVALDAVTRGPQARR
jgi:D-xylose transport system permease protein